MIFARRDRGTDVGIVINFRRDHDTHEGIMVSKFGETRWCCMVVFSRRGEARRSEASLGGIFGESSPSTKRNGRERRLISAVAMRSLASLSSRCAGSRDNSSSVNEESM